METMSTTKSRLFDYRPWRTVYLSYLTLELRRRFQYRTDFWLNNFFMAFGYLVTFYALWGWIFERQDAAELNGYSFHKIMWYYVLAAFILQMTRPRFEIVAGDIYSGGLSKYLLYPASYFGMKFASQLSYFILTFFQLILAIIFFNLIIGLPLDFLSSSHLLQGLISIVLALLLYFAISMNLEMFGFWYENVWAITYLFQYATDFFGGRLVPYSFFPDWSLRILSFLPFNFLISFPTRTILGDVGFNEWLYGSILSLVWIGIFSLTASLFWRTGLRQYSGVGI